jgi:eukaryotic-like serine/threonine-protein kinase
MTPTVTTGATRLGKLRDVASRRPIASTAVGGFLTGFVLVALWLLPQTLIRGESAVPNVIGLLYSDAAARLSAAGFSVKTGESLYHPTAPKSSVLGQTPAPGVKSAKGNDVTLDVSLGAKRGTVANVMGMTREAATKVLESAGFDVAADIVEKLDKRPRGEVVAATPRIGSTVIQPATVKLTVSAGPDAIGVPALVGMPMEDALALIGQLGLTAAPTRDDTASSQPEGIVSGQRPAANAPVVPGSPITLTISRPRAAPRDSTAP